MYEAVQKCTFCGANLTLDDMRKTNCPYCNTIYPHHSQAAQHAQVAGQMMNQMMAQQAQIQNQWRGAFGVGPMPMTPPPGMPGSPYGAPGSPYGAPGSPYGAPGSPYGAPGSPYGAPGSPYGAPGTPYGDPTLMAQAQLANVNALSRRITLIVTLSIVAVFLITGLVVALSFFG